MTIDHGTLVTLAKFYGLIYLIVLSLGVIGLLLAIYLVYRLAVLLLRDFELGEIAEIISYVWLAIVAYSWVAPMIFNRMLQRELDEIEIDPDY